MPRMQRTRTRARTPSQSRTQCHTLGDTSKDVRVFCVLQVRVHHIEVTQLRLRQAQPQQKGGGGG